MTSTTSTASSNEETSPHRMYVVANIVDVDDAVITGCLLCLKDEDGEDYEDYVKYFDGNDYINMINLLGRHEAEQIAFLSSVVDGPFRNIAHVNPIYPFYGGDGASYLGSYIDEAVRIPESLRHQRLVASLQNKTTTIGVSLLRGADALVITLTTSSQGECIELRQEFNGSGCNVLAAYCFLKWRRCENVMKSKQVSSWRCYVDALFWMDSAEVKAAAAKSANHNSHVDNQQHQPPTSRPSPPSSAVSVAIWENQFKEDPNDLLLNYRSSVQARVFESAIRFLLRCFARDDADSSAADSAAKLYCLYASNEPLVVSLAMPTLTDSEQAAAALLLTESGGFRQYLTAGSAGYLASRKRVFVLANTLSCPTMSRLVSHKFEEFMDARTTPMKRLL